MLSLLVARVPGLWIGEDTEDVNDEMMLGHMGCIGDGVGLDWRLGFPLLYILLSMLGYFRQSE